jgi:SAM-dependent methyltransferase
MSMWDERYAEGGYFYGTEPNDFLREQAGGIIKGGRVLCLAEGEGRNAVYLAGLGLQVTGVDGSAVGLEKTRKLAAGRGVQVATVLADLAEYKIVPGAWDAIVSIWCHLPKPLRRKVHSDCVAGLKAGGLFILEAYTPRQLEFKTGGPPTAELLMTLADLKEELRGLDSLIGREIDRAIQEGMGHSGQSAVVQVVGSKPRK